MTTFREIRKQARTSGVKIYGLVRVTYDDVAYVQIRKGDFLHSIKDWDGSDEASCCDIGDDGNISVG